MPWIPIEEMKPDWERRYKETVATLPDPTHDARIALGRQEREAAEIQEREQALGTFAGFVATTPGPAELAEQQRQQDLSAFEAAVQQGMSTFGRPPAPEPAPTPFPGPPRPSFEQPASAGDGGLVAPPVGGGGPAQAPPPQADDGSSLVDPFQRMVPNLGQAMPTPPLAPIPSPAAPSYAPTDAPVDPSERMIPGITRSAVAPDDVAAVPEPTSLDRRRPAIAAADRTMTPGERLGLVGEVATSTQPILFGAAHGAMTGEGVAEGILGTAEEEVSGEQLLEDAGMEEGLGRRVGGRVLEAVVDPLNFLPIGLGGKFRGGAQEALLAALANGDEAAIAVARNAVRRSTVSRAATEAVGSGVLGGVGSIAGEEAGGALGERLGGEEGRATGAMIGSAAGSLVGGGIGATRGADILEAGTPRALKKARDVSEWIEQNGLTPGLGIRAVKDAVNPADAVEGASSRMPTQLMRQLSAGEKLSAPEVLNRVDEIEFISAEDAAKTLREAAEEPGKMPAYLNAVQDFMLAQREKTLRGELTVRDVAKAYAMTLSSIGSAEIKRETAEAAFGPLGDEFVQANKRGIPSVRPEEAAAGWLFSEPGQRALDAIERGEVDEEAWRDLIERRRGYGRGGLETVRTDDKTINPTTGKPVPGTGTKRVASDFLSPIKYNRKGLPDKYNLNNLQELTDALNAAKGDPAKMNAAITKAYGLSAGKVGFVKSLLGFGDTPTFDAVELNFWLTGQGDVSKLKTPQAGTVRALKGNSGQRGRPGSEDLEELGGYLSDPRISEALRDKLLGRIRELQAAGLGTDMDPTMAAHLMHHWIWDKAKGVTTSHEGMMKAQRFAGAAPGGALGGLAGLEEDDEGETGFDPMKAGLGVAAGTLASRIGGRGSGQAVRRTKPLSERAERLMAAYGEHGQRWADQVRARAIDDAARDFGRGADRDFLARTLDALERRLPEVKNVMTEVTLPQLDNILSRGQLLSKFDSGLSDDEVALATAANVGPKRFAKAGFPSTPEGAIQGARDFVAKEREADRMVLGGTDIPRIYARVTEGQALPGETKGLVHIVWEDDTPRITSLHHHFAHAAPDYGLHKPMPTNFKTALWRDAPGETPVDLGGGRSVIDTPWTAGPEHENTLRAANLMMAIPGEVLDAVKAGRITDDPEELAAAILRGQRPRGYKPLEAVAEAAGRDLESSAADEFTMGASLNRNRSESLIVEPDLAHVKALYVVGTPEDIEQGFKGIKRNPSPLEAAESIRDKIRELTGKDVPIIRKDISLEGDKLPPESLSPGRAAVRDQYTRSGLTDIGGFNPAGAAAGSAAGLAPEDDEDDPDAPFDLDRAGVSALGMMVGALAPRPGVTRSAGHQRTMDMLFGGRKGPTVHADITRTRSLANAAAAAWTDRNVHLNNWEKATAAELGRPLLPEEMASQKSRVNPQRQAEVFAQEKLAPILKEVGPDRPHLEALLQNLDVIDKAKSVGRGVEQDILKNGVRTPQSVLELRREQHRLRGMTNFGVDQAKIDAQQLKVDALQKKATADQKRAQTRTAIRAKAKGVSAREERLFPGDIKLADAYETLDSIEREVGPEVWDKLQTAQAAVRSMMDEVVDMKVKAGIWSPELADSLKAAHPNYIPINILDYMKDPERLPIGKKIGLTDQGLHALSVPGTKKDMETPLAAIYRHVVDGHVAVARNDTFQAFTRLADHRANQVGGPIVKKILTEEEARRIGRSGKLPPAAVTEGMAKTNDWDVVAGFVDGKVVKYAVDHGLAAVIKNDPGHIAPPLITAMMTVLKAVQTSASPLFLASNASLDAVQYVGREAVRSGGPQHIPGIMSDLAKAYRDEFVALARGEDSAVTRAFHRAGGGQAGYFSGELGKTRKTVEDIGRRRYFEDISSAAGLKRLVKDIVTLQPVQKVGQAIENAPRAAAYRRSLARNKGNELQAMIDGRSITMDFAQGGNFAKVINQYVPFFNVGMQGAATIPRIVREGKEMTGSHRAFLATGAAMLLAPLVITEAWNRADPQRSDDYDDVPDYVKDQGMVVMWPTEAPVDPETGDRRPQYTLIRLREFAPFAIAGREVINRVTGNQERAITSLAAASLNAVAPVRTDEPASLFSSFNPLAMNTGLQLANDTDFFRGGKIATERNDQKASALSRGIAGVADAVSYGAGGPEVRPSQVEFAGSELGGGVYRSLGAATDIGERAVTGEELNRSGTVEDVPVLGGVARRFGGSAIGANLQRAQDDVESGAAQRVARERGLSWRPQPAMGEVDGVKLNRAQQAAFQRSINRYANEEVGDLLTSAEWVSASADEKEEMLSRAMTDARHRAANDLAGDPGFQARQLQRSIEAVGR